MSSPIIGFVFSSQKPHPHYLNTPFPNGFVSSDQPLAENNLQGWNLEQHAPLPLCHKDMASERRITMKALFSSFLFLFSQLDTYIHIYIYIYIHIYIYIKTPRTHNHHGICQTEPKSNKGSITIWMENLSPNIVH